MKSANRYEKSSFVAARLRIFLRAVDFVCLLVFCYGLLFYFYTRSRHFVEYGPGPTRLFWLKRILFRSCTFVDQYDFGVPSSRLLLFDVSCVIPTPAELGLHDSPCLCFADHCFEHLQLETVSKFVSSVSSDIIFRVPNARSEQGLINYEGDATHVTKFSDSDFSSLFASLFKSASFGFFFLKPWHRFYAPPFGPRLKAYIATSPEILVFVSKDLWVSRKIRPRT